MGNFSPVDRDEFKKHNQNVFATVIALWTLGTYYAILAAECESEAILFKKVRPGHRAGVMIWENFHPGYGDQPALSNEHIAIFTKKRVARRDF